MFLELLDDYGLHGCLWRYDWRDVKHGNVAFWMRWIVRSVTPRINLIGLRVALESKDFYNTVPYRLALKTLCYRNTL
jgi:hypothetical protein